MLGRTAAGCKPGAGMGAEVWDWLCDAKPIHAPNT